MILNFQLSQGHENHLQDFENSVGLEEICFYCNGETSFTSKQACLLDF